MGSTGQRKSVYFFIILCIVLVAVAVALNVGWIVLNWREVALLVFGVIFFLIIIAGLVLNTIFLVREIRRNEQHDSFINAVTHELKTPIASIRLYLETLQTRQVDEKQRSEFYRIMLDDSDRLLHTVEQVLRAGRSGHKTHQMHSSQIDLRELTIECVEIARTRTHLTDEQLKFMDSLPAGTNPMVKGDADEIRAAVSNLIDNAIKYSDEVIDITVQIFAPDSKYLAIRVRDRGIGIPAGQIDQIFKRFYRVPRMVATRIKGTGLGLYIVQSVVKKHGGRVIAESPGEGLGSTITIYLPGMGKRD